MVHIVFCNHVDGMLLVQAKKDKVSQLELSGIHIFCNQENGILMVQQYFAIRWMAFCWYKEKKELSVTMEFSGIHIFSNQVDCILLVQAKRTKCHGWNLVAHVYFAIKKMAFQWYKHYFAIK